MTYLKSTFWVLLVTCLTACSGKVSNEADTSDLLDETTINIVDEELTPEYSDDEDVYTQEDVLAAIQNTAIDIVDDDVVTEVKSQEEIQRDNNRVMTHDDAYGVDDATKSVITKDIVIVDDKPVISVVYDLSNVEHKPEFPGGDQAMYDFISQNIRYPLAAQEDGITGTVVVQFTIGKDGMVTEARAFRSPHESLSKEAVRIVMSMPKWTPARNQGQPVAVYYTLPVRFRL